MILRPVLLGFVIGICGCAAHEEWSRSSRPALPYYWVTVAQDMVQSVCRPLPGFTANACAIYSPDDCVIVAEQSEAKSPEWLVEHEKRHCAGGDHRDPVSFPQLTFANH